MVSSENVPVSTEVRLAGVPIFLINGEIQKTFRSRRALGLLAYLVCQQRPIPRAELVDLLWPDKDESKGRGNLRWAASYLSTLMPGCLDRTRQSIQFVNRSVNGDGKYTVDIVFLGDALERGDLEALADLLPHVQGEFMQGVYFDKSAEFESWVVSQRERLQQQVSDAFIFVVAQLTTMGQYEQALSFAQQWVEFTPWEEQAYRWTMELLARLGRIKAAIKQYEICHQKMEQELGSEPSAALVSLFERLQQTTDRTSSMLLTQQRERFIGRTSELTIVHEYRTHRQDNLIVFTGSEGCGKTRLAHAVVDEDLFLARHNLLSIDGRGSKSPKHLAEIILEALTVTGKVTSSARIQDILEYIEILLVNRDLILLLDDVPEIREHVSMLQSLAYTAPKITILVTSRQPCQLTEGKVVSLKGLSQDAAVQLFTELCERRPSGFQMQANDMPYVRTICRRLDNNPRAILLAAMLIDTMRCEEIAEQLNAWLNEPTTPAEEAAALVWGSLSEDMQKLLQQLTLFDGMFTLQSAEGITGIGWDVLKQMSERSLLHRVDEGWYIVPAALKQFIMTHYPLPQTDTLYVAYAEYMINLVETTQNDMLITKMQPHIHATWWWLVDQKRTDLLRNVAIAYANVLDKRFRWRLGYEMFQYAIEQFQGSRQHKMVQPFLWYGYGLFALRLREFERAKHNLLMAHNAIKGSKKPITALFPFQLGILSNITNNYKQAYDWFAEAYQSGHTVNNYAISNRAGLHLLYISFWMGKWEQSKQWVIYGTDTRDETFAHHHIWLGYFALAQGAYKEAAVQLKKTELYAKKVESDALKGEVLHFHSAIHSIHSNWDDAKQCLDESLLLKRKANAPQTYTYCELARLALLQGDPNGAQPFADRALNIATKLDDLIGRVYSLVILGDVQIELNQMDEAAGTLYHALVMSKSAELMALSMHALAGLARVAWYRGNYSLADRLIVGITHSPYSHHQTIKQLPPPSANSPKTVEAIDVLIDEMLV